MQVEPRAAREPEMNLNMNALSDKDIDAWEWEGGAVPAPLGSRVISMSRMANPGNTEPDASSAR